jgi:arylsulfatase A-like enzyme
LYPNVLLIVFDTARADVFEPYGAPRGSTPAVAQLAAEGFAHPKAYAPASWTVPSHVSLFSGLLPGASGIHLGGQTTESFRHVLRSLEPRLLQSVLGQEGYFTAAVSANGWVNEPSGFNIGFESFEYVGSSRNARLGARTVRSRGRWALEMLRANLDDGAQRVSDLVANTIRARSPFFCFVNLVECHSPYLPPKPFNRCDFPDRLRAARDANRFYTFESLCKINLGALQVPPESLKRLRSLYDDSIRQLDHWLSRILSLLDEARLLNETQVIVTSDHGENFGEQGFVGHQFSLDDRLIRVPFVTAGPLELTAPPVMSLCDVPRMIGNALGLSHHPWIEGSSFEDVAVSQLGAFAPPGHENVERAIVDWSLGELGRQRLYQSISCATDGHFKLIRDGRGERLVDLATDPLEAGGVTPVGSSTHSDQSTIDRLRQALNDADANSLAAPVFVEEPDDLVTSPDEDAQLEEQMRLLGYI